MRSYISRAGKRGRATVKIDDKTVEYVAELAKLELSEREKDGLTRERAKADLERILAYMETMKELDTKGIEPMSHVLPLKNVVREDIVRQTEPLSQKKEGEQNALLDNAPIQKDGYFVVPKTVEG
ncbi:MAG: Asp-tRNA(Asn)/Glu-tRNA(Gln) amidotransferase subunit GatC [Lachnospiraceae bacterium]|nr:Asp-tRNA(Asn)/Glu-tRNA(Gln) amidotransferase subunit GatC [Lachnospiraceae bacterium]